MSSVLKPALLSLTLNRSTLWVQCATGTARGRPVKAEFLEEILENLEENLESLEEILKSLEEILENLEGIPGNLHGISLAEGLRTELRISIPWLVRGLSD